ncbi:phasin family protein [Bradyrhizobium lupini]|uniref:phasin family protein n=1 Tax=Rhizobium lupini TaxID=136996 RepID=UPI0036730723
MNGVSREYLDFVRQHVESSMDRMNELWRCRTPHELAAVQIDLVRDTIPQRNRYQPSDGRHVPQGGRRCRKLHNSGVERMHRAGAHRSASAGRQLENVLPWRAQARSRRRGTQARRNNVPNLAGLAGHMTDRMKAIMKAERASGYC